MNRKRYQKLEALFDEALNLQGQVRRKFLDHACADDPTLRQDLERMLAVEEEGAGNSISDQLNGVRELFAGAVQSAIDKTGDPDDSDRPAFLPEEINGYRILKKLGEGGMGTVYLAEQQHPQRRVALKMIRAETLSPKLMKRFRFEAEVLGRLKHPGIAQIFEAGEIETPSGRLPYFAMEYVEGVELRRYAKEQNLGVRKKLELVARIADAMHHAHRKGIVHRDLKPENVLVVEEPAGNPAEDARSYAGLGRPKVLDFGVARATDADVQMTTLQTDVGQLVGTITYMSPEQVGGDPSLLDVRSDIYALGVLFYELLAGRPPFDLKRRSIPEATRIIREEEPTRLGSIQTAFRGDIDTIACKALEKDRDRRYASAADLAADIRRYLANEPIVAHPPSTFYEIGKFARRHKGLVSGLGVAFLILVIGIASSLTFGLRAVRNEKLALESKASANRTAYRLKITTAEALGITDPHQALAHLESVPPEFRGWEWRHQFTRFDSQLTAFSGDTDYDYSSTLARHRDHGLQAALNREGGVELVDVATGNVRTTIRYTKSLIVSAISLDGALLSTWCPEEQKMMLWDVGRNECIRECRSEVDEPFSRISQDRSCWAVRTKTGPSLNLFDISTGRQTMEVKKFPMEFDSTSQSVLHEKNGCLYLYSVEGHLLASTQLRQGVRSLAFSPDERRLAIGHWQRIITIRDASTLEVEKVLYGHDDHICALTFSRDGKHLASASEDHTVRVWDVAAGSMLRVITSPESKFRSLMFSEDGSLLAAGSADEARLWKWKHDGHRVLEGHDTYVYCIAFSPDGTTLATSGFGGDVRLWDSITGDPLAVFEAKDPHFALGYSQDGSRLIFYCREITDYLGPCDFRVMDPSVGIPLTKPRSKGDEALFKALHEDDDMLRMVPNGRRNDGGGETYASSYDGLLQARVFKKDELRIWDVTTGETILSMGPFEDRLLSVAFSPDSSMFVTGDQNGLIKVWDLKSGHGIAQLRGHVGRVFSLNFSPDQRRLASGGNDGNVVLWNVETCERVAVLRGHTSYVHAVRFSPDGSMIASASGDGTVRIWDSVLPAERWKQEREARKHFQEAEPLVDDLFNELGGNALDVADHLRTDEALNPELRKAALRVLLTRSVGK